MVKKTRLIEFELKNEIENHTFRKSVLFTNKKKFQISNFKIMLKSKYKVRFMKIQIQSVSVILTILTWLNLVMVV